MTNAVIGALRVNLGIDSAAFTEGLNRAQRQLGQFGGQMQKLGGQLSGIGARMSVGITAPLAVFGTQAARAAIDAEELQSAFNYTFGDMADSMNAWAETTGDAMGRSTQALQQAAFSFGTLFNQAAPTAEAAAALSQEFSVLAQDAASFFNVTDDEALQKLRAGLVGEAEPLRQFGVFLTAAATEARALQMGLAATSAELTEQDKIMARAALITEALADASGDVARTSGSTANQIRASQAAWQELSVTIGQEILPALTPLVEALGKVLRAFTSLPQPMQTTIVAVAAVAAAIGPLLVALGGIITVGGAILPALAPLATFLTAVLIPAAIATAPVWLPIAAAIAAVGAAIFALIKYWPQISEFAGNVAGAITEMAADVVASARALYDGVKAWLQDKLSAVIDFVVNKVAAVGEAFRKVWDLVVGHSYVPDLVDGIAEHFGRLDRVMVNPALSANDNVAASFESMADRAMGAIGGLARSIKGGDWKGIIGGVAGILSGAGGPVGKIAGAVSRALPGFANGGSFTVGGVGGIDSNVVAFRATRGERVTVDTPGGARRGGAVNLTLRNESGFPLQLDYVSQSEARLIASQEVTRQAPRAVASELANANSVVSKAMQRHTSARPSR